MARGSDPACASMRSNARVVRHFSIASHPSTACRRRARRARRCGLRPALAYCCPRRKTRRFACSGNRCARTISCWPGRVQGWIYSYRPELRCSFLSSDRLNPFRAARYGYVAPMPTPKVSQRLFSTSWNRISAAATSTDHWRAIFGTPSRRRESWRSTAPQAHVSPPSCPRANSLTEPSPHQF